MSATLRARVHARALVMLRAEDPEAVSALAVARERVEGGEGLAGLWRGRWLELDGDLPEPADLAERLHGSTQFYNPTRERCVLRGHDPWPFRASDWLVLVVEPGGERRAAAERWWRHETGARIEVREGVLWCLRFAPGVDGRAAAESLAITRDRRHGLFANPHFQRCAIAPGDDPPPHWIAAADISAAVPSARRRRTPA